MSKYIKYKKEYNNIESICNSLNIKDYIINNGDIVDVNESVDIQYKKLNLIPLKFGKVVGSFNCSHNNLYTMKYSPNYIGGSFRIDSNFLENLKYSPIYIGYELNICRNNILTLDGINEIKYKSINFYSNPICKLLEFFNYDVNLYLEYLDIYGFQKDNILYKIRFSELLLELGIKRLPRFIEYDYI